MNPQKYTRITENELSEIYEHWPEGAELVERIYAAIAERDALINQVEQLSRTHEQDAIA